MCHGPGADVPSEIISAIVENLHPMIIAEFTRGCIVNVDDGWRRTKGLAACSLVCRHWAKIITPMLFERVVLFSQEDVQFLRDLLADDQPLRTFFSPNFISCVVVNDIVDDIGVVFGNRSESR